MVRTHALRPECRRDHDYAKIPLFPGRRIFHGMCGCHESNVFHVVPHVSAEWFVGVRRGHDKFVCHVLARWYHTIRLTIHHIVIHTHTATWDITRTVSSRRGRVESPRRGCHSLPWFSPSYSLLLPRFWQHTDPKSWKNLVARPTS